MFGCDHRGLTARNGKPESRGAPANRHSEKPKASAFGKRLWQLAGLKRAARTSRRCFIRGWRNE
jgi:hypothetical protein